MVALINNPLGAIIMNEEMNKPQEAGAAQGSQPAGCCYAHTLIWPILIIAVGIIMLFSALGLLGEHGLSVAFALLVIAAGVLLAMKRGCRYCGSRRRCRNGKCGPC